MTMMSARTTRSPRMYGVSGWRLRSGIAVILREAGRGRRKLLVLIHFAGLGVVEKSNAQGQVGAVEFTRQR